MQWTKVAVTGLIVGTLAVQAPYLAQAKKGKMGATAGVSAKDKAFMREAALGGMAEVHLGQLASDKASSNDVKQFGQQMVTDHSKANDELKSLAATKGVSLPTGGTAKDQATYNHLAKLSGAAFDRAYVKDMVTDHKHDVNAFATESKSAHDPDLRAWAGNTLPTLRHHLDMITTISHSMSSSKKGH